MNSTGPNSPRTRGAGRTVTVVDDQGTPRSGPRGAWWANLTDKPRAELPAVRLRAWNVAALAYLAGAVFVASRLGELVGFVLVIVGGVAVCLVGCVLIERRTQAQAAARLAAFRARQAGQAPVPDRPASPARVRVTA